MIRLLGPLFQVVERVNHVLKPVHVVSEDVPISKISVWFVLYVTNLFSHDVSRRWIVVDQTLFQHGYLQFAQDLQSE